MCLRGLWTEINVHEITELHFPNGHNYRDGVAVPVTNTHSYLLNNYLHYITFRS